jgi:hypothetical protein
MANDTGYLQSYWSIRAGSSRRAVEADGFLTFNFMLTPDEMRAFERFVAPVYFTKNSDKMINQNELSAVERFTAPTPKFQQYLQLIGLFLTAMAGVLMKLETENLIELPVWLSWVTDKATAVAGVIAIVIAQFSVDYKAKSEKEALSLLGNLIK